MRPSMSMVANLNPIAYIIKSESTLSSIFYLLFAIFLPLAATSRNIVAAEQDKMKMEQKANISKIVLGGGCFWCIEAIFERINGVIGAVSGYAGGASLQPNYQEVSSGETDHAEVVEITFDSSRVTVTQLAELFFNAHDPTTLNRQGADIGTQYRSIVLYNNEEQRKIFKEVAARLEKEQLWKGTFVTEYKVFEKFYPAEKNHQDFYDNNRAHPYCSIVIGPKLYKVRQKFSQLFKDE